MPSLPIRLAETLTNFGAKAVYGEAYEADGVRIVPVALLWYGFGGGSDAGDDGAAGGGGGGATIPVGAYVTRGGDVRFEPNVIALLGVAIPAIWVTGRALARVIRALKK
ncbi:MAG: aerobic-type carbon monoxide dehydrogenase, large subunit CoxL/CutL s [Naasia sp.]|nr:aerobic-type carbon monoxide dehydrogenase, large subunit CoxL/CutL s [Naasia sp.]